VLQGLRVAVIVPAYNEEAKIGATVRSIPAWVDRIVVVDDASVDDTGPRALATRDDLRVVRHPRNRGVGAAVATGYEDALAAGVDVAVVMAGDGQMDPADLPALLAPIAAGRADYVKGNRFLGPGVLRAMPWTRLVGNVVLSMLTKLASGYWHVFDSQCGYTAASRRALEAIGPERIFARYGYPNDILGRLAVARVRVEDVPVRALYPTDWRSGIGWKTLALSLPFVLSRCLVRRVGAFVGLAPETARLASPDGPRA
jgi:glycosyltransferase involved in cell wall biosynthesis